MAYTETMTGIKANVVLNNGTSQTGNVLTKNISIGTLNPASWDVDKYGAIATALSTMFTKAVYDLQSVKTYSISE